ncbi:MAG: hypothetical protein ACLU4B_00345 [Bilophila wadsworthia]
MSIMRSILCLTPSSLAFVLGGAHFWRAGQYPFSVGCMLFALLVWRREAWIRQVTLVLLPLLAARWVWAAAQFVQIRMFMEQPWMRLACILLGVSLFTATAALLLEGKTGDAWYARGRKRALMRTAAFFGTIAILTPLLFVAPQVFLTERFLPGWAPLHILLAGFWASWVASRLGDRDAAPRTRLFIWRLFSVVFFVQLALGLAGYGLFLMTGNLHLPVPGMILAAPLYRGGGLFMPILFGVSVLLAGAAWCSHPAFQVYRGGLRAQGCPASALDVSPPAGFLWAHAGSPRRPPVVRRSDRGRRCARFGAGPAAPARCGAVEPPVRFRLLLPCRMPARAGGELARQDRAVAHPADRCLYALPRLYPRLPIRCADS